MYSAQSPEHYPSGNIYSSPELAYLFEVASERFQEAAEKQSRNKDTSYYSIEAVGDKIYYVITLVSDYSGILTRREDIDIFEVLIPSILADIEVPAVEQIYNNPDSKIKFRKNRSNKSSIYLTATPKGIKIRESSKKDFFQPAVSFGDAEFNLAEKLRDYELIPANVPPRYTPADMLLNNLGIKPSDA